MLYVIKTLSSKIKESRCPMGLFQAHSILALGIVTPSHCAGVIFLHPGSTCVSELMVNYFSNISVGSSRKYCLTLNVFIDSGFSLQSMKFLGLEST